MERKRSRLTGTFKLLAFASIGFVALLPPAVIGLFQHYEFAKDTIDQLGLHLSTISHQGREGHMSPPLAVAMIQNNRLVLWSTFYQGDKAFSRAGLPPTVAGEKALRVIEIDPDRDVGKQLPAPNFLGISDGDYRVRLPLGARDGEKELLEIGVSYATLYSMVQDGLALSGVMFLTTFLFLLGAVVFVDAYISSFTMRVLRAVRSGDKGQDSEWPAAVSPTFTALMDALERREDQLIDTRDTLETIFNGLQIGVAMVSTEMRIVLVNHFLMGLLKVGEEEDLISEPCSALNLRGQSPTVEALCRRTLQRLAFESQELEVVIDGSKQYFLEECYPLFGGDGRPVAMIIQCRNITTERTFSAELQRQLEEQRLKLEDTHQKLLQSGRLAAIGELAGGVAHEINNPNGVILAGARYVLNRIQGETGVPEYVAKYLQRIVKQSERVADIVRALLTFSRRRPQQKGELQIQDAINDALELAHSRFGDGKVRVEKALPDDLPAIEGNRNELTQVFLNLVNNAIDAMPEGGVIRFGAEKIQYEGQPAIQVSVRDTGEGIPKELVEKVFEPFFTTKPVGKGTGLGLSISHGIIEEHSGRMRVRNHPEGGAEFEIVLPVTGPKPEPKTEPKAEKETRDG